MSTATRLISWFRANARPLPWRTKPRYPYATLVSELMAQQTQLDRVVPKFEAFMHRFPDLPALAIAAEDEVLELWSGLGYYRRARLLHRLAREVAAGSGELPTTASDLEMLPGIGPYTAAAIASMVHGEVVPVMDGNVARVGARVLSLSEDPRRGRAKKAILEWVEELMRDAPPGEINEALMELGATLCSPVAPGCDGCPIGSGCRARLEGRPEAYPPPRRVRAPVSLRWLTVIVEDADGRWLVKEITDGPILRGLWLPPFAEIEGEDISVRHALGLLPFQPKPPVELIATIRHSITHRKIEVTLARLVLDSPWKAPTDWQWIDPRTPNVPTSSLLGKMVEAISQRCPSKIQGGSGTTTGE